MAHNESQLSADVAEQSLVDDDEQSSTEVEELLPEDSEADIALVEQRNKRFLQAVSYLIEWAKHIITLGSALMVLARVRPTRGSLAMSSTEALSRSISSLGASGLSKLMDRWRSAASG